MLWIQAYAQFPSFLGATMSDEIHGVGLDIGAMMPSAVILSSVCFNKGRNGTSMRLGTSCIGVTPYLKRIVYSWSNLPILSAKTSENALKMPSKVKESLVIAYILPYDDCLC